jgi:hypothetical protein
MSSPGPLSLPALGASDFGPGKDHVSESYQGGRVFAIVHKDDPVRQYLASLLLDAHDPYAYVFVHGGQEVARFQNTQIGSHEIPFQLVAQLLVSYYGNLLNGMLVRMCTCYGNMLRPGDTQTTVQGLARVLTTTQFEAYHGLVHVDPNVYPPRLVLGDALGWDPISGPHYVGPPGTWEPVVP